MRLLGLHCTPCRRVPGKHDQLDSDGAKTLRLTLTKTALLVLVIGIGAISAVALVADRRSVAWRDWVKPVGLDNARRISFVRSSSDIPFSPIFVTAAAINQNQIALADYRHLYCLQRDLGHLSVVDPFLDGRRPPVWEPTGLAYDPVRKHLFVANYHGNQVYEGLIDCETRRFVVVGAVASSETISPENVALSDDGATVAVANYDAGTVVVFRRMGKDKWTPLWSQRVPLAHGIAIFGGAAYATGLQDGTLTRFDLETGRILLRVGKKGWNPRRNEMLWPTALAVHDQRLLLSDAHTGLVCQLDSEQLRPEWCLGGNGPSPKHFNAPYGVASLGVDIVVVSTFQGRVLVIRPEPSAINVIEDYVPDGQAWTDAERLALNPRVPPSAWLPTYERAWLAKMPYVSECRSRWSPYH